MDIDKLENLKSIIDKRYKELSKRSFDKEVDSDGDEGDEAQSALLLNMIYEFGDRNNAEITSLYEALQKIKDGEFGLCEECGDEINHKRLEICPSTKYCIKCAEMIEKETKSYKYGRIT